MNDLFDQKTEATMSTDLVEHQTQPTALAMIQDAIARPDIDPERLGKMLDIFERLQDSDAKKQFNEAMNAAKKEMPRVIANRVNTQTNSKYSDLEHLNDIITPIYLSHGLTLTFGTAESNKPDHIRVTCDVLHNAGHEKPYFADLPVDDKGIKGTANKTGVWGAGSTMSYARRYLELLIFDIAVHKEDDDGQTAGATIDQEQIDTLNQWIESTNADLPRFLGWLGLEKLADMSTQQFPKAMHQLKRKAGK